MRDHCSTATYRRLRFVETINVVFATYRRFRVNYFNKMTELVFYTVFSTHMLKNVKKTSVISETKRCQTGERNC